MRILKDDPLVQFLALIIILSGGCCTLNVRGVPPDFMFTLDAHNSDRRGTQHVFIRINARGHGYFECYDTGGTIEYDENGMVTYDKDQVVAKGDFQLREAQVEQLWQAIKENDLFYLNDDYRMSIGSSYAFIAIEAGGHTHTIDNIGMEVPKIRAFVEKVNSIVPAGAAVIYGEGFKP